jgi:hypothetical protein
VEEGWGIDGKSRGGSLGGRRRKERERKREEEEEEEEKEKGNEVVDWVGVSPAGYLLSYSRPSHLLTAHSLNGRLLARLACPAGLSAFCFSHDGQVLIVGTETRRLHMLWCHSLRPARGGGREGLEGLVATDGAGPGLRVPSFPASITTLALTTEEKHLLVGLGNGQLYILTPEAGYLRARLKKKLETMGFY